MIDVYLINHVHTKTSPMSVVGQLRSPMPVVGQLRSPMSVVGQLRSPMSVVGSAKVTYACGRRTLSFNNNSIIKEL